MTFDCSLGCCWLKCGCMTSCGVCGRRACISLGDAGVTGVVELCDAIIALSSFWLCVSLPRSASSFSYNYIKSSLLRNSSKFLIQFTHLWRLADIPERVESRCKLEFAEFIRDRRLAGHVAIISCQFHRCFERVVIRLRCRRDLRTGNSVVKASGWTRFGNIFI